MVVEFGLEVVVVVFQFTRSSEKKLLKSTSKHRKPQVSHLTHLSHYTDKMSQKSVLRKSFCLCSDLLLLKWVKWLTHSGFLCTKYRCKDTLCDGVKIYPSWTDWKITVFYLPTVWLRTDQKINLDRLKLGQNVITDHSAVWAIDCTYAFGQTIKSNPCSFLNLRNIHRNVLF